MLEYIHKRELYKLRLDFQRPPCLCMFNLATQTLSCACGRKRCKHYTVVIPRSGENRWVALRKESVVFLPHGYSYSSFSEPFQLIRSDFTQSLNAENEVVYTMRALDIYFTHVVNCKDSYFAVTIDNQLYYKNRQSCADIQLIAKDVDDMRIFSQYVYLGSVRFTLTFGVFITTKGELYLSRAHHQPILIANTGVILDYCLTGDAARFLILYRTLDDQVTLCQYNPNSGAIARDSIHIPTVYNLCFCLNTWIRVFVEGKIIEAETFPSLKEKVSSNHELPQN